MATVEQSLYNIAAALEVIAEELKTLNDAKLAVKEYEAKIQELETQLENWQHLATHGDEGL
jgi:prefoldin subunit 5